MKVKKEYNGLSRWGWWGGGRGVGGTTEKQLHSRKELPKGRKTNRRTSRTNPEVRPTKNTIYLIEH